MKKTLFNTIKCILFLAMLAFCVTAASILVKRKDSDHKYADFFDKAAQDQIDVLFFGSSHVINACNPCVLFEDYGITSYNMGGHGSVMQATYWELMEALNYTTPKYVVVDTFLMQKDYKFLDVMEENATEDDPNVALEQLHLNMDAWPTDHIKLAAVTDMIQSPLRRMEFLFTMTAYHDRWKELTKDDYEALFGRGERNRMFGAEMRYNVERFPKTYPDPEGWVGLETYTVGEEYLEKIIDECQNRNIGVIVTFLPCSATTEDKKAAISAEEISAKYDVPFYYMLDGDIIDLYTDLNDTGHLNALGATKVTQFLGEILMDTGEFEDHRGDPDYDDWQEKADAFYRELADKARESDNLYQQLNYLSVRDVSCVIYINEGSDAFSDERFKNLICNISGTDTFRETDGPYILIRDQSQGKEYVYEARDSGELKGVKTAMGMLNYRPVEHMFRLLYTDEDPDTNYLYDDEHYEYDIQIIVYSQENGEILGRSYYKSYGNDYEQ
ncbi:hypothetical protein [Butyrivibrio sp. FCS014]|uniref:hypothetical protein n=1 Tax=Butyrivibrio sp. FCS014 TaxID=1408304 RepID=UPI0004669E09|nr:hypothetical protein [Butyrivibrio sp. FCS014]